MKKFFNYGILGVTVAAGIAVVSQLAIAEDKKTDDKKPSGILVLDTNKDGALTLEEMKARPVKGGKEKRSPEAEKRLEDRFKQLDKNSDGKIDAAEIEKFEAERNKPITKKEFMKKAEERAEKSFERLDTNKDGSIDVGERKAAREEIKKRIEERRAAQGQKKKAE